MPLTFFGYSLGNLENVGALRVATLFSYFILILSLIFVFVSVLLMVLHLSKYRVAKVVSTDENVIKVVRKHWIIMAMYFLRTILLIFLPVLFYKFFVYVVSYASIKINLYEVVTNYAGFVSVFYFVWLLISLNLFAIDWTMYYLDLWIITNKRILCIDQKWFFNREVISFNYEQIQDITVETRGFLQNMLDFGLLNIETAGEKSMISIENASSPEDARSIILEQQEKSFSFDRSLGNKK